MKTISKDFFQNDAIFVAKNLLGKIIVRNINGKIIKARIVETEAYMGVDDKACHSYGRKKTKRTLPMYDVGGTIYVYLVYGMYYCFNIVVNVKDNPQAVLIRAVQVISGQDILQTTLSAKNFQKSPHQHTNGPGKLCLALKIDSTLNHISLFNNNFIKLYTDNYQINDDNIIASRRVNVGYAQEDQDKLWRFYLKNNKFVSKYII